MKAVLSSILLTVFFATSSGVDDRVEDIQFVCMKTHKASNTCHFNFKVDGANYRFVDVGCRYNKKQHELIKKVEDGSIFLAKDWKISCPEAKEDATRNPENGL